MTPTAIPRPCQQQVDGVVCGALRARYYLAGWCCEAHTPAAVMGRPDPTAGPTDHARAEAAPRRPPAVVLLRPAPVAAADRALTIADRYGWPGRNGRWTRCPACGQAPAEHPPGCGLGGRTNYRMTADGRMVHNA